MRNVNTFLSYGLRTAVLLHASFLALLFLSFTHGHSWHSLPTVYVDASSVCVIAVLLVADWGTKRDPARRFSKLIDSFLAGAWILSFGALTLYSLSMGMP